MAMVMATDMDIMEGAAVTSPNSSSRFTPLLIDKETGVRPRLDPGIF
ncbi:hypothetical protein SAMN02745702_00167 [Desulfobaculum bizertense DSM 18034]|uniref:Uncharacterized protein n=1 Tax=Desulfobaculum bizertense DSM 18034 TaxID=1121442 RepID=A0A1T4VF84_9BACT|nr:hypothetical protein SAMN02745702_00167 [Desulfobaculum bizertense DSM 18034]